MSAERDIQRVLDGSVPDGSVADSAEEGSRCVTLAAVEVKTLLNAAETTLLAICQDIERSSTRESLRSASRNLNRYIRVLTAIDPHGLYNDLIRDALISLHVSQRLKALLGAISPVTVALVAYKKAVIKDLAISLRQRQARIRLGQA